MDLSVTDVLVYATISQFSVERCIRVFEMPTACLLANLSCIHTVCWEVTDQFVHLTLV